MPEDETTNEELTIDPSQVIHREPLMIKENKEFPETNKELLFKLYRDVNDSSKMILKYNNHNEKLYPHEVIYHLLGCIETLMNGEELYRGDTPLYNGCDVTFKNDLFKYMKENKKVKIEVVDKSILEKILDWIKSII